MCCQILSHFSIRYSRFTRYDSCEWRVVTKQNKQTAYSTFYLSRSMNLWVHISFYVCCFTNCVWQSVTCYTTRTYGRAARLGVEKLNGAFFCKASAVYALCGKVWTLNRNNNNNDMKWGGRGEGKPATTSEWQRAIRNNHNAKRDRLRWLGIVGWSTWSQTHTPRMF